jgi:hypothetical protein
MSEGGIFNKTMKSLQIKILQLMPESNYVVLREIWCQVDESAAIGRRGKGGKLISNLPHR